MSVKRLLGSSGHVVKANATIDGFHTFNSHLFNKLALDKIRLMKDVLDATKQAVVFTDSDNWLRNPFALFSMPSTGIGALPEGQSNGTPGGMLMF